MKKLISKDIKKLIFAFISLITITIITVIHIGIVTGVFWACFSQGEEINFCNPLTPDRTCRSTQCFYCMASYNASNDCYNQGNLNACNSVQFVCESFGNGSNIDSQAPNFTVISPMEGAVYTKKSVLLTLKSNEYVDMAYLDLNDDRGRWTQVCNDCASYNKSRSFDEGLNELVFRAVDGNGNRAFINRSFFIDTKKPKITKTLPKKSDFAAGSFELQFKELNPVSAILYYGNNETGWWSEEVDIGECSVTRDKYTCSLDIDINDYDNQTLYYWFNVTDIAGMSDASKQNKVIVDTTYPIINYLYYNISGSKVTFNMSIIEENFDEIEYIDNSESRPRWRTLCGSLKNGMCVKKITFDEGDHSIDIQVSDEVGNSVASHIDFFIA